MVPPVVAEHILYQTDIDTRMALKMPPRKLDTSQWDLLVSRHDGLVYIRECSALFNFRLQDGYSIMRPVNLDINEDELMIFNLYEHPYTYEFYSDTGYFVVDSRKDTWATELKVLLR
jgi:hypothetical protein